MTGDLLSASWDAGKASVWAPAGFELTYTAHDGKEIRTRLDGVHNTDLDGCLPVRSFPSYKGQRNYPGLYWSATMGRHVGFESWVERNHLITLDFAPEVTAIASQPFWLHWRTPAGKVLRHAPDFLARLDGGRALVIDSRPRDLAKDVDREAFAATRLACEELGWGWRLRQWKAPCLQPRRGTQRGGPWQAGGLLRVSPIQARARPASPARIAWP
jgi:hypothetical protein